MLLLLKKPKRLNILISLVVTVSPILLERKNWNAKACLGISHASLSYLYESKNQYLHEIELAYFEQLHFKEKWESFLKGRYVAKKLLGSFLQTEELTKIAILPGVFSQPVVFTSGINPPSISIAHTDGTAAALAFPREHPMGLDIETIREQNAENIASQITAREYHLYSSQQEDLNTFYTRIWTVKEALSKVLTTGLTVPMDFYQVGSMEKKEGYTLSTFDYFEQYKAISFELEKVIFSLALPKNTTCMINSSLLASHC